jgi:hypothetical protein
MSVVIPNTPADYKISKWATYYDAISYASAKLRKINNIPDTTILSNITDAALNLYDPLCDHFNAKIFTHCWYRSDALTDSIYNDGKHHKSNHVYGYAIDLDCDGSGGSTLIPGVTNASIFYYIVNNLDFQSLIWESGNFLSPGWVHASYAKNDNKKYLSIITPGMGEKIFKDGTLDDRLIAFEIEKTKRFPPDTTAKNLA